MKNTVAHYETRDGTLCHTCYYHSRSGAAHEGSHVLAAHTHAHDREARKRLHLRNDEKNTCHMSNSADNRTCNAI